MVGLGDARAQWSFGLWYDLRYDLSDDHLPVSRHDWLLLVALTADKYMIDEFCDLTLDELRRDCTTPYYYTRHYYTDRQQTFLAQERFMQEHYHRCKELWEGEYPEMMYSVISTAYFELVQSKVTVDLIENAVSRNVPLSKYYDSLCLDGASPSTAWFKLRKKWRK